MYPNIITTPQAYGIDKMSDFNEQYSKELIEKVIEFFHEESNLVLLTKNYSTKDVWDQFLHILYHWIKKNNSYVENDIKSLSQKERARVYSMAVILSKTFPEVKTSILIRVGSMLQFVSIYFGRVKTLGD